MPASRRSVLLRALEVAFGAGQDDLSLLFTHDVKGWSPTVSVSSLAELEERFDERDDALSDVTISIDSLEFVASKAITEWRLTALHSGPMLLADDLLIEPTGCRILLAGATVAEFREDKICSFRSYFDDAALLEQFLLTS